jgi:hypothetical protein
MQPRIELENSGEDQSLELHLSLFTLKDHQKHVAIEISEAFLVKLGLHRQLQVNFLY